MRFQLKKPLRKAARTTRIGEAKVIQSEEDHNNISGMLQFGAYHFNGEMQFLYQFVFVDPVFGVFRESITKRMLDEAKRMNHIDDDCDSDEENAFTGFCTHTAYSSPTKVKVPENAQPRRRRR